MTERTSVGARLVGSLRSADGKGTVHIEDRFDTDIKDLWSAITDPVRLARWLGTFEGDLRLGGVLRARFFASEWEGTARVEVCDPPRRLVVRITETDAASSNDIEVNLLEQGEQTVLIIEQRGMPRDHLAAYGAGMQVHVEDLAAYLRGEERCDARARWTELLPSYQSKAIGPT